MRLSSQGKKICDAGRIVERGPAAIVSSSPQHPYTKALFTAFPSLYGERRPLAGLPGDVPDLAAIPVGCRFRPRCPEAVDECSQHEPALEAGPVAGSEVACILRRPAMGDAERPA